ncbi:MAG: hypothetical protein IT176_00405 [Acidobacteria bacterium]|nr:hypothetical protein [Acidobacteriota bacterium]
MGAPSTPTPSTAPGLDLLQYLAVRVPCAACGQHYEVSLRQVLLSQDLLHEGCPIHTETECLPLTYAALANEGALRDLERSWALLLDRVRMGGFDLTVCRPPLSH